MKSIYNVLKNLLFSLLIVILPINSSGQDKNGNPLPHFLFPSFKEGFILMKDGQKFTALLNYNLIEEKMITEADGVYRYSKNPGLIDQIHLENRVFFPVGNVFYELLSNGPAPFFLQNKSNATPMGTDVGYGVKSRSVGRTQYNRFELTEVIAQYGEVAYMDIPPNIEITPASVFWIKKNETWENFSTEKQFLKIFPEYERQLKEFINREKIKIRLRDDIIKLGNYCNALFGVNE